MDRIYFKDFKIRGKFFDDIKSKFSSWKELREFFNIAKSSFEKYKNGKSTMPIEKYEEMVNYLSNGSKKFYNSKKIVKDRDWGRIKGGINNYKKNRLHFEKNRKKAWETTRKKNLITPKSLDIKTNIKLAEVLGAFIGDGFFNKYNHTYLIQFAGDNRYDHEYYNKVIIPYVNTIISNSPYIRIKDNAMWINFYSKYLFYLLLYKFKMVLGKKAYTVKIPKEIISNKKLLRYTLRGIFDTDGCIYYDKRKVYKTPYVRIALHLANMKLINQIKNSLDMFGIKCGISKRKSSKTFIIQINGFLEVRKYLKIIGFSNPRHLNKIKDIKY